MLVETLEVLARGLGDLYGIERPSIAVLGLNPHAGEGGLLGEEELTIVEPAIRAFRSGGGRAGGPFSADSFFALPKRRDFDVTLALYHDQGLVAVKCLAFGRAVNVTLGLPVVRTSVDHGCGFDIAGRSAADAGSMEEALRLAADLLERRQGPGR